MDARFDIPPRLRLNRQAYSFAATVDDSNIHATLNFDREAGEDGDDDGSTPRLRMSNVSIDSFDEPLHFSAQAQAQSTPAPNREPPTPAERLRAVLSRASSATPTPRTLGAASSDKTPPVGTSLLESDMESSDFETPRGAPTNGVPATPYPQTSTTSSPPESAARTSLRSIFTRALRSPGNTPERPQRTRRGSMDSSIAEESPIKWSMMRAGEKAQRLSLSDDEKDRIRASRPGFADGVSENSVKSAQAATYDQLRERLLHSTNGVGTSQGSSVAKSDDTIDMEEATEVEQELFSDREVPIRSTISHMPPSMSLGQSVSQFPSQYLGSNLLTENSDMRRIIHEVQSEIDSEVPESKQEDNKTPHAGPSSNHLKGRPALVRERTLSRNGSIGSLSASSNSRPTSRQSMNGFEGPDRKRERERGWNHPLGPYMERHRASSPGFSPTQSGGFARIRKVSLGSTSGSESNDGRMSPMSLGGKQESQHASALTNGHPKAKYAGLSSTRFPSSSPSHIRVRTVSQPSKPTSPSSLANSTSSNGTQKPVDRSRSTSLTARNIARSSSSIAHGHSLPGHGHNGIHDMKQSERTASPSSLRPPSRSSSRASSHLSESPDYHRHPNSRERKWSSPRPERNGAESSPLSLAKARTDGILHTRTPAEHPRRTAAAHASSPSPSSIPRLSVNMHSHAVKHVGTSKQGEPESHKHVASPVVAATLSNGKDKDIKNAPYNNRAHLAAATALRLPSSATSVKLQHKAHPHAERNFSPERSESPTPSSDADGIEEPAEQDTPKIGLQSFPDSPTPVAGSSPNSHAGKPSGFSHLTSKVNDRANVTAGGPKFASAKEQRRRSTEENKTTQRPKVSLSSGPLDLHDSDFDSFQEEDIVASSSAPRMHNGNESFEVDDGDCQADQSLPDINALRPHLRPHQDVLPNGPARNTVGRKPSILPGGFSPPSSPSLLPSDPITTTPQRRSSANVSKVEFKTPSPPKDIPALPDPPSPEKDFENDRIVPVTPARRNGYTGMKTPRPPGAWSTPFATPAPALTSRRNTLPNETNTEEKRTSLHDEVHTPAASYSRATAKTPAPPGAWLATPATITAKRHQQKVRFDEQDMSAGPVPGLSHDDGSSTSDTSTPAGSSVTKASGKAKPSPHTPGRIRVVDAFGNEITPMKSGDKPQKRAVQRADELHATVKEKVPQDTRKSRIRVVDALGREIDEDQVQSATKASTAEEPAIHSKEADIESVTALFQGFEGKKLQRGQALQLLQKTITGLKDDLTWTDDPANTQTTDVDAQLAELKVQSIRAREDRERLLRKIRDTKPTDPSSRSTFAWDALLRGKGKHTLTHRGTYLKVFAGLVLLQIVVTFVFYQLSSFGARRLFLTTYIDPFYPELYIHVTNPEDLHLSRTSTAHSDAYAPLSPSDWTSILFASWHAVLNRISTLRETLWDVWRDPPRGMTWPPT